MSSAALYFGAWGDLDITFYSSSKESFEVIHNVNIYFPLVLSTNYIGQLKSTLLKGLEILRVKVPCAKVSVVCER